MATAHKHLEQSIQRDGLDVTTNKALTYLFGKAIPNRITATADQTVAGTSLTLASGLNLNQGVYRLGGNPLIGGNKYHVKGVLFCLGVTSNGIKVDLNGGTCSATTGTQINYKILTATTVADSNVTSLSTAASATTVVTKVEIDGYIVCNGSGSLAVRFSESANSTGAVVYAGSYLEVQEVLA